MQKTILIIGSVWPEPNSSAAGTRMMQLISIFQKQAYEIIFVSTAQKSEYMIDLKGLSIQSQQIQLNNSSFDVLVKNINPSVVLFDRFMIEEQFGWRISENCPNALKILDTEDLHCLRLARQKAFKENKDFILSDLLTEEVAQREIASILRCDLSLIISEFEIELLLQVFKIDSTLLHYLPFLLENISEEVLQKLPAFENRSNFVFIGNFLHEPNWNAVQYLKESIWNEINKELPNATLEIYGAYPSQKVFQLNNTKEKFVIKGRAENAFDVIKNARVLLAPLRFGAGIKGKLIDAMQVGTPNITTSIGAESMNGNLPWSGFVADSAKEFATAAILLYQNKKVWEKAQSDGFKIISERFQVHNFESQFMEAINNITIHLKQHRKNNFFGKMLQHHTLLSVKYMSRWIECKNK